MNKFVWSSLGWNPDVDITDALRDYGRYFIGPDIADAFAQGLLALERNWRGPLLANSGVDVTLAQFQEMERKATPQQKLNWRFQEALYRAHYDAYLRTRLLDETERERRAMERLAQRLPSRSMRRRRNWPSILCTAPGRPCERESSNWPRRCSRASTCS